MGNCMGVRRAEVLAMEAARDARAKAAVPDSAVSGGGKRVLTFGPLIHNPQAVAALEREGVRMLDPAALPGLAPGSLADAIVVIRAHGASAATFDRLKELGAEVLDATCPRVLAIQRRARRLSDEGALVVVAGDAGHGEVKGIVGHATGAQVAGDAAEAAAIARAHPGRRIALLSQTTILQEEYDSIKAAILAERPDAEAFDSICPATAERQAALRDLDARVDGFVIVGGRSSANTTRLMHTALQTGKPAWHVETADEIPAEAYACGRIGLTAGASTPASVVDEVEARLRAGRPG